MRYLTAALCAFSSKLSVTDGDVAVMIGNDHPGSVRRDRARLLDRRLQPWRGLHTSIAGVASHPIAHSTRQKQSRYPTVRSRVLEWTAHLLPAALPVPAGCGQGGSGQRSGLIAECLQQSLVSLIRARHLAEVRVMVAAGPLVVGVRAVTGGVDQARLLRPR